MLSSSVQLLISLILSSVVFGSSLRTTKHATIVSSFSKLRASYDYVVIGGGTSGLTVADRLTENSKSRFPAIICELDAFTNHYLLIIVTVLVIEYGYV